MSHQRRLHKSVKELIIMNPEDDWSFLDAILVSKGRGVSFTDTHSIDVLINQSNAFKDSSKPKRF